VKGGRSSTERGVLYSSKERGEGGRCQLNSAEDNCDPSTSAKEGKKKILACHRDKGNSGISGRGGTDPAGRRGRRRRAGAKRERTRNHAEDERSPRVSVSEEGEHEDLLVKSSSLAHERTCSIPNQKGGKILAHQNEDVEGSRQAKRDEPLSLSTNTKKRVGLFLQTACRSTSLVFGKKK